MALSIDPSVYAIQDSRVALLKTGAISHKTFANMITQYDPFMIIGDTVYALSEQEFYMLQASKPNAATDVENFNYLLDNIDTLDIPDTEKKHLHVIKDNIPKCTVCRYKKYKNDVLNIAKSYSLQLPAKHAISSDLTPYPKTAICIPSKVLLIDPEKFRIRDTSLRTPCLDCVEKHCCQASILANEYYQGYTEHLYMALAHLSEALSEAPIECIDLKNTLSCCISISIVENAPFVPIGALLNYIGLERIKLQDSATTDEGSNEESNHQSTYTADMTKLDITQDVLVDLHRLPAQLILNLYKYITNAQNSIDTNDSIAWQGNLANAADLVLPYSLQLANIFRQRRILFVDTLSIVKETGNDFTALLEYLDVLRGGGTATTDN